MKPRLCVDFDATIYDGKQVMQGCVQVLAQLRERFHIAIYSSRATDNERYQMMQILQTYAVPLDEILPPKPQADFYLDDKGRQFTSWDNVLGQLK